MNTATPFVSSLATHVGRVRTHNEDSLVEDRDLGLLVLADGMGGHQCGEVASELATRCILDEVRRNQERIGTPDGSAKVLESALRTAHQRILESAVLRPECTGMGTTVVACIVGPGTLTVAHVGDSRLYRLRAGVLQQITRDHSLLQELIDQQHYDRDQAIQRVRRNVLTRAVGIDQELKIDLIEETLEPGDLVLLCSDGLTDMLADTEIAQLLRGAEAVETLTQKLIEAALTAGGLDNVSVALARPEWQPAPSPRGWRRLKKLWDRPWAAK